MTFVAVVIALEKLLPRPEGVVRFFGVAAVIAGVVVTAHAFLAQA